VVLYRRGADVMVIVLGFLISFAAGWSIAACDAVFRARADERPAIFQGTGGMILLLIVAGVGGLTVAGAVIWFLQSLISAGAAVILAGGAVLGGMASRKLHVNAAGAANRMMAGLAVLAALYALVWTWLPPAPVTPPKPSAPDVLTPSSTPQVPISK
jgi:hypothetical protein